MNERISVRARVRVIVRETVKSLLRICAATFAVGDSAEQYTKRFFIGVFLGLFLS